jgi:hypothetical protein
MINNNCGHLATLLTKTVIIVDRVYFIAETRHSNRTAGVRPACVFNMHGCPRLYSLSFWAGHWRQVECGRDLFDGSTFIQERTGTFQTALSRHPSFNGHSMCPFNINSYKPICSTYTANSWFAVGWLATTAEIQRFIYPFCIG